MIMDLFRAIRAGFDATIQMIVSGSLTRAAFVGIGASMVTAYQGI